MTLKLRWVDGFELSNSLQTLVQRRYNTASTINIGAGRQGWGRSLRFAQYPGTLVLKLTTAFATTANSVVIGFGFKFNDPATVELIAVKRSGATQASIWLVRDSSITAHFELRRGSSTVLASSGVGSIASNQWLYLEWRVFVSNTGSTEFRIDQIPLFEGENVDTQETGTAGIDDIWLSCITNSLTSEMFIDDLYVIEGTSDTEFLGAISTQAFQPISDANAVFQGPSGAQPTYPYVSESTPDDLTFITPIVTPSVISQLYNTPGLDINFVRGEFIGYMLGVHHDSDSGANETVQALFYDPDFGFSVLGNAVTYNGIQFIETIGCMPGTGITDIERDDIGSIQIGLKSST